MRESLETTSMLAVQGQSPQEVVDVFTARVEAHAKACQNRWPQTAALLFRIATDYREKGKREDKRAEGGDW